MSFWDKKKFIEIAVLTRIAACLRTEHDDAVGLGGILANAGLYIHLNSTMNARFAALESRFDARFDVLLGKVVQIDNRLIRVEERMGIR